MKDTAFESDYLQAARSFLAFAGSKGQTRKAWLVGLQALARLYGLSAHLPESSGRRTDEIGDEVYFDLEEAETSNDPEEERLWKRFTRVGDEDLKTSVFSTGIREMADGLCKVYYSLRRGLEIYETGNPKEAFIYWRQGYEHFWGLPLVEGMATLHMLIFEPL
jgi:hypothetical protein